MGKNKIMKLGIPYMGSKRKLAPEILNFITQRHTGLTDFYDLFGGGGSISFTAVRDYRFNVHYNELNRHIFSLVDYLRSHKELDPKFYQWVTREMFFEQIEKTNEQADWYSGYVMSCWSFGNSQSSYLYGAEIEAIKRLAHNFIVDGCLASMKELGVYIPYLVEINDINKRRLLFCDHIKQNGSSLQDNRVQNLELVEHLTRMQNLKNLQNLQNLQITNNSYELVNISGKNAVIYCDIPYKGTGEYKEGGFDHESFYKWFSDLPYPAYLSEYGAPFEQVHALKHRSSLSATNNKKQVIEKIFWNGKGSPNKTTLF